MTAILLDTHVWVWSLFDSGKIALPTRTTVQSAEAVFVSPISFYEIGQKVRLGKWPAMEEHVDHLADYLNEQSGLLAALHPELLLEAARMDWDHRDPFDRILAATAIHFGMPIVSADGVFDALSGQKRWPGRIW
jgi:PIN domain nuclease of toxin-antitoxin system